MKYLLYLIIGIILFVLLNSNDRFSVGVPEYKIVLNRIVETNNDRIWTAPGNDVFVGAENIDENIDYFVYANSEIEAISKLDSYIVTGGEDVGRYACGVSFLSQEEMADIRELFTKVEAATFPPEIFQYYRVYFECIKAYFHTDKEYNQQFPILKRRGELPYIPSPAEYIKTVFIQFHQDVKLDIRSKLRTLKNEYGDSIQFLNHLQNDEENDEQNSTNIFTVNLLDNEITSCGPIIIDTQNDAGNRIIILNFMIGNPGTFNDFHQLSSIIYDLFIKYLSIPSRQTGNIHQLVLVGHSSGAGLLLAYVNYYMNTMNEEWEYYDEELIIQYDSMICITSGLGLCDSFIVDTFEDHVSSSNGKIQYFDIMNMTGLPRSERCWLKHYVDTRMTGVLIKLYYNEPGNWSPEIKLLHNFTGLNSLVDGYQEYNPEMFVHFARDMSIFLEKLSQYSSYQPGTSKYSYFQTYYDYYQRVYSEHLENDPKLSELCFSDRRAFTCKDFTNLFFKHVSNEYTYALLPDPDGGLFSYDKNELVYSILGDDIWRFENVRQVGVSGNDDIIINDKLCLSKNRFREVRDEDEGVTRKYDFGAHMLKTYYESLSDFGYALPIS